MTVSTLPRLLVAFCLLSVGLAEADDRRDKQVKKLDKLSARLNRYATGSVSTPEREFLHERVTELLNRTRKSTEDDYIFGRLTSAIDNLLDASDEIEEAFEDKPGDEDTQQRAARKLEDTYFDLKQGDHFADQSGDSHAAQYIRTGRRLYQAARAAYEQKQYAKSRHLAEAARELVAGLESLAQAAVRIPTPPKL
jgi:hypothetical protein